MVAACYTQMLESMRNLLISPELKPSTLPMSHAQRRNCRIAYLEIAECQNLCFSRRVHKIGGAFQENGNGINAYKPFREFVLPSLRTDN